jgi:hypothetical protein
MAIRIRRINGYDVALCAALSKEKEGDLYLHDGIHHALSTKFGLDWQSEGILANPMADLELIPIMLQEQNGKLT